MKEANVQASRHAHEPQDLNTPDVPPHMSAPEYLNHEVLGGSQEATIQNSANVVQSQAMPNIPYDPCLGKSWNQVRRRVLFPVTRFSQLKLGYLSCRLE